MPVAAEWLKEFNDDYAATYKKAASHFMCPILLRDEDVRLCNGHILCDAFHDASGFKVPQREDLDNWFGAKMEPDLIRFLNLPVTPTEKLFGKSPLEIELPDGSKIEALYSKPKTDEPYQSIGIIGPDGKQLARRFVRSKDLTGSLKQARVSWSMPVFKNTNVVGSLVKCGYLALFRLMRYRWVMNCGAYRVRKALRAVYAADSAGIDLQKASIRIFREFDQSSLYMEKHTIPGFVDTIASDSFLTHRFDHDDPTSIFALSCVFTVNGQLLIVTLPGYDNRRRGYGYYRHFLKNRMMKQFTHLMTRRDDKLFQSPQTVNLFPIGDQPAAEVVS